MKTKFQSLSGQVSFSCKEHKKTHTQSTTNPSISTNLQKMTKC